jgi:hypothetical protein
MSEPLSFCPLCATTGRFGEVTLCDFSEVPVRFDGFRVKTDGFDILEPQVGAIPV